MNNIVWVNQALTHLQKIYDYYAETNEKRAFEIITEINNAILILKSFPQLGQIIEVKSPINTIFRTLLVYKGLYKVVYYHTESIIYVFAVWDCRQNPEKLLDLSGK